MQLGEKVHQLRKQAGLNLQTLAQKSGVSLATLSKLENSKVSANIATYQKVCDALGITLGELYRDVEEPGGGVAPLSATSPDAQRFHYDEKAQAIFLATDILQKNMMPQLITLQPGGCTHQEQTRLGVEKWLYVSEGTVEVTVGEQRHLLKKYDALYFKASAPHQLKNPGKTITKCICVTSPVVL